MAAAPSARFFAGGGTCGFQSRLSAMPQWAMPHSGSAFNTSSKTCCDARYQNECWYSMARLKCFCASGLHDVSKFTLPSFVSSDFASAGCAHKMPIAAGIVTAQALLFMFDSRLTARVEPQDLSRDRMSDCE